MDQAQLNWVTNFIWSIADDVLRDVFVRGKYRDVILPMTADLVTGKLDVREAAAQPTAPDDPLEEIETEESEA